MPAWCTGAILTRRHGVAIHEHVESGVCGKLTSKFEEPFEVLPTPAHAINLNDVWLKVPRPFACPSPINVMMMMILLLFLQKQNLASAIYLFGLGTRLSGPGLKHMR